MWSVMTDYSILPANLPVPEDDGYADHLQGIAVSPLTLPASDGSRINLGKLGVGGRCATVAHLLRTRL